MASDNTRPEIETLMVATRIVAAFVSNNKITANEIPGLLQEVYGEARAIAAGDNAHRGNQEPAVPISKSVRDDYVICLEDGKKLKMLKRYLRTHYEMTPEDYRRKWGLPADYPMVAPNYSKRRSQFAKKIGLGRKEQPATKSKRKPTKRKSTKRNITTRPSSRAGTHKMICGIYEL